MDDWSKALALRPLIAYFAKRWNRRRPRQLDYEEMMQAGLLAAYMGNPDSTSALHNQLRQAWQQMNLVYHYPATMSLSTFYRTMHVDHQGWDPSWSFREKRARLSWRAQWARTSPVFEGSRMTEEPKTYEMDLLIESLNRIPKKHRAFLINAYGLFGQRKMSIDELSESLGLRPASVYWRAKRTRDQLRLRMEEVAAEWWP